jgi:hypothetical protein
LRASQANRWRVGWITKRPLRRTASANKPYSFHRASCWDGGQVVKAITTNNVHNSARIKHSAPILPARILKVTMVNRTLSSRLCQMHSGKKHIYGSQANESLFHIRLQAQFRLKSEIVACKIRLVRPLAKRFWRKKAVGLDRPSESR